MYLFFKTFSASLGTGLFLDKVVSTQQWAPFRHTQGLPLEPHRETDFTYQSKEGWGGEKMGSRPLRVVLQKPWTLLKGYMNFSLTSIHKDTLCTYKGLRFWSNKTLVRIDIVQNWGEKKCLVKRASLIVLNLWAFWEFIHVSSGMCLSVLRKREEMGWSQPPTVPPVHTTAANLVEN